MLRMFMVLLVCAVCSALPAHAEYENNIGLFSTDQPEFAFPGYPAGISFETIVWAYGPGSYETYLVCREPMNLDSGEAMEIIGGFELKLLLPDGWFVEEVALPPDVLDFDASESGFHCAGLIPVGSSNGIPAALLATITLGTLLEKPGIDYVFLAPCFMTPSIPGHMAITDADDAYSLHMAFPRSGSYDLFVMTINSHVDPVEDRSWGDVKALYR